MLKWMRENKYAAILLLFVRFYVGWKWLTAGWNKITAEKAFDAGGFVKGAIANPVLKSGSNELLYPNYVAFLSNFALPNIKVFNVLVSWGEFLVGLGLILGCLTGAAAFFGLMMNFTYMFAGSLSTNPWMVLLGFIILLAGPNAGKLGIDYFMFSNLRYLFHRRSRKTAEKLDEPVS